MIRYGIIIASGGICAHYLLTLGERSAKEKSLYQDKKNNFFNNENFNLFYNPFAFLYTYNKEDSIESLNEY